VLVLAAMVCVATTVAVRAADLPLPDSPRYTRRPMAPPRAEPYAPPPLARDPGPPPSEHGYFGYYGLDIFGSPYNGERSADVLCLRSIATPYGYRTVNVCPRD
jgi:hypothetical protein